MRAPGAADHELPSEELPESLRLGRVADADWWVTSVSAGRPGQVSSLVPAGFEGYLRITSGAAPGAPGPAEVGALVELLGGWTSTSEVFVSAARDGRWSASWQRGGLELEIDDFEDDRDSCLAWALEQPALLRLVRWPGAEEYVALDAEPA